MCTQGDNTWSVRFDQSILHPLEQKSCFGNPQPYSSQQPIANQRPGLASLVDYDFVTARHSLTTVCHSVDPIADGIFGI